MFEFTQTFLWVALFVAFVVGEIISLGITSIWFAGGALIAFIVSLFTDVLWIQVVVFVVVSLVLLALTRPLAKKFFNSNSLAKTNVEAVVGQVGLIKEVVSNINGTGVVFINGLEWSARTEDGAADIAVGSKVIVKEVKGVTLIVKPVA